MSPVPQLSQLRQGSGDSSAVASFWFLQFAWQIKCWLQKAAVCELRCKRNAVSRQELVVFGTHSRVNYLKYSAILKRCSKCLQREEVHLRYHHLPHHLERIQIQSTESSYGQRPDL